jgi:hypothetical protein
MASYTVYSVENQKQVELQQFNEEELALFYAKEVMEDFDECELVIEDQKNRPVHRVSKDGDDAKWQQFDYSKEDNSLYN